MSIFKKKNSWFIWSALLVFYLFMAFYGMGEASKAIDHRAKDVSCAKPLDLHVLGLTYQEAQLALDCMGNGGRIVYHKAEQREDIFYPISYGLFFAFTIFSLASFLGIKLVWKWSMAAIPLCVIISDFIENSYIVRLIDQFPALEVNTVDKVSLFNTIKWSGFFITLTIILILGVLCLVSLLKSKKKNALVVQD